MFKNLCKIGILALFLGFSGAATAATIPDGCYEIDGKFSVALKIPGILNLNVSSPQMKIFGVQFQFMADQSFAFSLPLLGILGEGLPTQLNGTWAGVGASDNFTVSTELESLVQQLNQFGIAATITKNVFKGKALSNGDQIKGNFNLAVRAPLPNIGTASLVAKGNYNGTRGSSICSDVQAAAFKLRGIAESPPAPTVTEYTEAVLQRAIEMGWAGASD